MSHTTLHLGGPGSQAGPYDVVVGSGLRGALPGLLGTGVQRVAVIHAQALSAYAGPVIDELCTAGYDAASLVIPDSEAAKDVVTAAYCWEELGKRGFTRSDAVVTVGGGATTDMGGFVAASWLRGVKVVHLPTTLLAMVDAAVGGKTGMNTAEGKNLVGAFHEPAGVICDLDTLATLPHAELVSGMAEVVKCGFIADPVILEIIERSPQQAMTVGSADLRELVERAVQVKIDVVSADLLETGGAAGHPGREALNYGHTLGHAIERAERYTMRHGEAIAVGMVYVAELARLTGGLSPETVARHREVIGSVGLPTSYAGTHWPELLGAMRIDKKSRGDLLRFVVLEDIGRPVVLAGPAESALAEAFTLVS